MTPTAYLAGAVQLATVVLGAPLVAATVRSLRVVREHAASGREGIEDAAAEATG